ncbi:MAG: protein kinase [candidate division Zixibacteria bacterium]|nr:protein kinase [candidate division Zixibacteria bacterium]
MIGQTVQHYRVTARLGAGGMGEVFLATDTKLGRQVALKFLPREFSTDPERRRRLELEATSASSLDHPNILTIYEINEHEGHPFIAMAYVEGVTLKEKMAGARLSLDAAIRYGIQVASALGAAHARGIVHRDVKPDNVLLGQDDRVRLTDFGLAKLKESSGLTTQGATVGTVGYMSPEQAQGMPIDARSDVFSLGVMLYQMLTGKLPFAAEHAAAALYSIVHETPMPIRELDSDVPPEVARVVERALAKKPDERYADALAMEGDLRTIARALEISRVSSGQIAILKPQRRWRMVWAATGAIAILVGIIFAFMPHSDRSTGSDAKANENTLAVMYFENLADPNDTARVGDIITELLTTDLSASEYVKVVSSQRLYDLLKHENADPSRRIGRGMATQIAKKAGAARMLSGALSKLGGKTIITAQLVDVASGDVVGSERVDGMDLYAMVDDLSLRIKRHLGLSDAQATAGEIRVADVTTASPQAYRQYLKGMDYYHALDWKFALAYLHKGVAYMSDGQREKGIKMLAAAGRHIDRAGGCDHLLLQAFGVDLGQGWNLQAALRDLKRATVECPTHKEPFFWVANFALGWPLKDYDTAVVYSRRALDLDPDYPFALLALAEALIAKKDFASARPVVTRYMAVRPNDFIPYGILCDIYTSQRQFDSALAVAYHALQLFPHQRELYQNISQIHRLLGHPDSALAWSEKMKSIDDNAFTQVVALRQMAAIHRSYGQFEKALRCFLESYKKADVAGLRDQRSTTEQMIGNLYLDTDNLRDALEHYDQAAQLDTLNADAVFNVALTNTLLGNARKGQEVMSAFETRWAGRVDSTVMQSGSYLLAARAALAEGQYQSAIDDFLQTRRLRRDTTIWRLQLGEAYIGAQKYDAAIAELTALRNDAEVDNVSTDYIRGLYYLAVAYSRSGRPSDAREAVQRFLVFWGNADWDLPIVQKAKDLYAGLSAQ